MEEDLSSLSDVVRMTEASVEEISLFESESLLSPQLKKGKKLYTEDDIEKIRMIKRLMEELEVNLPGVAVILNMREQMMEMREEFERIFDDMRRGVLREFSEYQSRLHRPRIESKTGKPVKIHIED